MRYNYSTDDFVSLAKEIHGDKYDYSKSEYSFWKKGLIIICPVHGEFVQSPQLHIGRKNGCPKCRWDKRNKTCLEKYGVPNPFMSKDIMTKEIIDKQKQTRADTLSTKYGVTNPSQIEAVKQKKEQTCISRYGVPYYLQSDEFKSLFTPEFVLKAKIKELETRKKHGTARYSGIETEIYDKLISRFDRTDVHRNYNKDHRYPFAVDFYIKSLDTFIEVNFHWTHGPGGFYDSENSAHKEVLDRWKIKAESSDYYKSAIVVWTIKDVNKYKCAVNNGLNYIVLWDRKDVNKFYEDWGLEG